MKNTASNNQSLGLLGWMAMISDTHNRLRTADFLTKLRTALACGGHHEILQRNDNPVAWLVWRQPAAQAWPQLLAECGYHNADEKSLQGQIWLDFWVRPFGCDADLAQLVARCLLKHGITEPRLCWHDPSVNSGAGALHLGIPVQNLQGM